MLNPHPQPVRGRFAPSPSGRMHLGNLFCALLAWLSIRAANGQMILRMEDLDPDRSRLEYAEQIEADLLWLGLPWDEGGLQDNGPYAPYCQSRRQAQYEGFFRRLEKQGLTYPCYCTREELRAACAPHRSEYGPIYSGRCRRLSAGERQTLAQRRNPAIRLCVPDETISFCDGLLGPQQENLARDCGDFILRRSDGVFAYQLAVVADDAGMEIREVVRGQDLLPSTARQIYLYRLLGKTPPQFFHIPLLLSPDGRRLSKRDKDLDLGRLRGRFPHPETLVGHLAHLAGLLPKPEPLSPQELIPYFSWEKVPRHDLTVPKAFF